MYWTIQTYNIMTGPSFFLEVIFLEVSTKPDLESISTLRVRAASGSIAGAFSRIWFISIKSNGSWYKT